MNEQKKSGPSRVLQVVAWRLGDETYGVEIASIYTVITLHPITPVPQTQPFIKGVMNMRGQIVPVIDLRIRFGLPEAEPTDETRIVIINIENIQAGLIVDSVSEVLRISESDVEAPHQWLASTGNQSIIGIGKVTAKGETGDAKTERLIILLDPVQILTGVTVGPVLEVA